MSSSLSAVPVAHRRTSARAGAALSGLMLVIAILPWAVDSPASIRLFAVVAGLAAVMLGAVSWSLFHSLRLDGAEADLDATITAAVTRSGFAGCSCGHTHDPDEMTIVDAPAGSTHDCGAPAGQVCSNDCASCVLSRG